ncbi:hypothetical protein GQR58_019661 [Nymphon striatum]|nr:hypothetical protein GQR58_019661 [Nymphon striatum]
MTASNSCCLKPLFEAELLQAVTVRETVPHAATATMFQPTYSNLQRQMEQLKMYSMSPEFLELVGDGVAIYKIGREMNNEQHINANKRLESAPKHGFPQFPQSPFTYSNLQRQMEQLKIYSMSPGFLELIGDGVGIYKIGREMNNEQHTIASKRLESAPKHGFPQSTLGFWLPDSYLGCLLLWRSSRMRVAVLSYVMSGICIQRRTLLRPEWTTTGGADAQQFLIHDSGVDAHNRMLVFRTEQGMQHLCRLNTYAFLSGKCQDDYEELLQSIVSICETTGYSSVQSQCRCETLLLYAVVSGIFPEDEVVRGMDYLKEIQTVSPERSSSYVVPRRYMHDSPCLNSPFPVSPSKRFQFISLSPMSPDRAANELTTKHRTPVPPKWSKIKSKSAVWETNEYPMTESGLIGEREMDWNPVFCGEPISGSIGAHWGKRNELESFV